jgi:hypothetical protein
VSQPAIAKENSSTSHAAAENMEFADVMLALVSFSFGTPEIKREIPVRY